MTFVNFKSAALAAASLCLVGCGGGGDTSEASDSLTEAQQAMAEIVNSRQYNLKDLGAAFKAISDEMRAGTPTSATVDFSIDSVRGYARDIGNWFPEGSGPADLPSVKMEAKAEIWTDRAGFEAEVAKFQGAVAKLVEAKGDAEAIPGAFRAVGGTCKSCHDNYRIEN